MADDYVATTAVPGVEVRQSTHWAGCWRAHHECAIALLNTLLPEAATRWDEECSEFGCHDALSDPTGEKSDTP